MKAWPYDSFKIETPLPVDQVIASLNSQTEPKKWFRFGRSYMTFQGKISSDGFEIARILHSRNSFLPMIRGRFSPGSSGTTTATKLGLPTFVATFMFLWFGIFGFRFVGSITALHLGQMEWARGQMMFTGGMLVFGWVVMSACFWPEVKKGRAIFVELLRGKERPKIREMSLP